jgi:mannose-6-phosphate isomerase-like protein (cupin superfamily)
MSSASSGYEIVDFGSLKATPCPCGTARRAFVDAVDFPATIHVTEISADARTHYHRRISEAYYFLECAANAQMQLNDEIVPVRPGMAILIRPGTRHRAIGNMKVLIVAIPKFDPSDEFED